MWPFGTSAKDRKRIEDLERTVRSVISVIHDVTGRRVITLGEDYLPYSPYSAGGPSIETLVSRIEGLRKERDLIMEACGLEMVHQTARTVVVKKKGGGK